MPKNLRTYWLPVFVLILVSVLGFKEAFAYERVLFNEGVGYATTTGQNMVWTKSAGNVGVYVIDCDALGIAEIASTTVHLYAASSANTQFYIYDLQSGQKSDNSFNQTSTGADRSFTFTPPVWCEGSKFLLTGWSTLTQQINFGSKGADNVDQVPHAYCMSMTGVGCYAMGEVLGADIAIIAVGSYSTSSGGGGECADCLIANQEIVEDSLNVIAGGTLVLITFVFLIVGVIFTIWVLHRFWR